MFKGDLLNPTYYPTKADTAAVTKNWYIIDAEGQTLGRLATLAATYIRQAAPCTQGAPARAGGGRTPRRGQPQCDRCEQRQAGARQHRGRRPCTPRGSSARAPHPPTHARCGPPLRRGKHLPTYTPSMDMGAYVIVVNAEKVTVTGNKANAKTYFRRAPSPAFVWCLRALGGVPVEAVGAARSAQRPTDIAT